MLPTLLKAGIKFTVKCEEILQKWNGNSIIIQIAIKSKHTY